MVAILCVPVSEVRKVDEQTGEIPGERTGEFLLHTRGITRIGGQSYAADRLPPAVGDVPAAGAIPSSPQDGAPSSYEGLSIGQFELVLQAARDLIVERGFSGVHLDAVALMAGLDADARNALHEHFQDGDALAADLLERIHRPLLDDLSEAAISSNSVLEGLQNIARHWVGYMRQDPALYLVYLDLSSQLVPGAVPSVLEETVRGLERNQSAVLAGLIAEGQMQGEIRPGDPVVLVHALGACFHGLLLTASNTMRFHGAGVYVDDIVEATLMVLIRGLRASDDPNSD